MTLSDFDYIANPQRFNVVNYYLLRKSHYEIEEIGSYTFNDLKERATVYRR